MWFDLINIVVGGLLGLLLLIEGWRRNKKWLELAAVLIPMIFGLISWWRGVRAAPREVTAGQRHTLVQRIGACTDPNKTVRVFVPINDDEATRYAEQVLGAFSEAKWSADGPFPGRAASERPGRITVHLAEKPHTHSCTNAVEEALVEVGIPAEFGPDIAEWEAVALTVGPKR